MITRFRFSKWMVLAFACCMSTAAYAEDVPKLDETKNSQLTVQWQQNTSNDTQGTRKTMRVVVQGGGKVKDLSNVKSEIEKKLESSEWPKESQTEAVDSIMLKLEEVTKDKPDWSGRVEWSSMTPGTATTSFREIKGRDANERVSDTSRRAGERAREAAERLADRAAELQKNLGRAQGWNNSPAPKYRLGIDCRVVFNEPQVREKQGDNPREENGQRPVFEIESVLKDSPAEQAGMRPGDQVQLIDGRPMESIEYLVDAVQKAGKNGEKLIIEVVRNDDHLEFELEPTVIAELIFNDLEQPFPFRMFGNGFPNAMPNNVPGFPGQFGPGWVMNREEMEQLQKLAEQANRDSQRSMAESKQLRDNDGSTLQQEVASLRKEVAELKEMLGTILEKLKTTND